ncbi:hypothetical protein ACIBJE_04200 [Micromonospora sp. NPDC050187]|uniref:hypothetical protein n=1 Tax=Micromonospora sp. NPDC050187 TaxID=3364277 RepID=UPI0037B1B058
MADIAVGRRLDRSAPCPDERGPTSSDRGAGQVAAGPAADRACAERRLLRNRNIRPHNARILKAIGDGPYVSDSTIFGLGPGRVVITPQYVTAFAHLLGYPPSEMVALTGIGPVVKDARVHPASTEMAALAWRSRRLNSEQLSTVIAAAQSIQHA